MYYTNASAVVSPPGGNKAVLGTNPIAMSIPAKTGGSETAAAIYTKHLKPQVAIAYVPNENLSKLIRDSRLSKASDYGQDKDALVNLYSRFWNTAAQRGLPGDSNQELPKEVPEPRPENTETTAGLSSPIIVYADLIATGGPRNLEKAQRLRDKYITEPDGTA